MTEATFKTRFEILTGHAPFPWQVKLFEEWFVKGEFPSACNLPTGLGKTSVVAIWLIALMERPDKIPRRLVYVVNRRTVVDQTTDEVEKLRKNMPKLENLSDQFQQLAISTLRGQFADNREWSADPSRPAVICGTVDMIGSRLLFSGYGVGFKTKPLHAGFLGQDVLLVHDEAHLEPAFQELLVAIEKEQHEGERSEVMPWPKLRVMELTATSRRSGAEQPSEKPFELTDAEKNPPEVIPDPPTEPIHHVWRRLKAKKGVQLHSGRPEKGAVAKKVAALAVDYKDDQSAVLIFVRTLEDVEAVEKQLSKAKREIVLLTGTMRGLERDALVQKPAFKRFLKDATPGETVYLLCTSAGEVGIDISADHMVCDLSPFDSMAQRLGRVNRYGDGDAMIDVVYPTAFEKKDKLSPSREETLALLQQLKQLPEREDEPTLRRRDASPKALSDLRERADLPCTIEDALTPLPTILRVTDMLFDAWTLTTIRGKLPGRPSVEPYLHGISEWQLPETQVAWRHEVEIVSGSLLQNYRPEDLLEDYPLKPHELLRDRSDRVFTCLEALSKENPEAPAWIIDSRDQIVVTTLSKLTAGAKRTIENATVLLPPFARGLTPSGMLDGAAVRKKPDAGDAAEADGAGDTDNWVAYDVADEWYKDKEHTVRRRVRLWDEHAVPIGMRWVCTIDSNPGFDEDGDDSSVRRRFWYWYELIKAADGEGSKSSKKPISLGHHLADANEQAGQIVKALNEALKLPSELQLAVTTAAKFHDLGKRREVWQRSIGNPNPTDWHAKSGKDPVTGRRWKPRDICPNYRHEFGSVLDVLDDKKTHYSEFMELSEEMRELALHLIASHHGRARPHFPMDEAFDPERNNQDAATLAIETPRRFVRLQRKYGRWGLAYLESLVRAADYAASANPSPTRTEDQS